MQETDIFTLKGLYRDDFRIRGYRFGGGEKTLCVVGAMRGNENQQLYAASQLVRSLSLLEKAGKLSPCREVMVIPCCNPYSINIRKRFWTIDNTDINRMFPGYNKGETTQRIADGIFRTAQQYKYGIQYASFYMDGTFAPHVRMMQTGFEDVETASRFGLPYIMLRKPRPFDTTTLNYNWQIWDVNAFSLYTTTTDTIDPQSAAQSVDAIINFLTSLGFVKGTYVQPEPSQLIRDENLLNIRTERAGFFDSYVKPGEAVRAGQLLAQVTDPYDGSIRSWIHAPEDGTVLFMHSFDMVYADTSVFKLVSGKEISK